jgi:hypothetical protein
MDLAVLFVGLVMGFIIAFFTIGPGNKPKDQEVAPKKRTRRTRSKVR